MIIVPALLLGVIIGSFLNVLVLRLNTGRTFGGRSQCLSCGHKLDSRVLIPVFSFIFSRGRCRYCGSKISWQYIFVELATGIIFGLLAWQGFLLIFYPISVLLIAIFVYDLRHKIIPDTLVYPFIILSAFAGRGWFTGLAFFAIFAFLWIVSGGRWMGFGDAKLVLGIGFLLGFDLTPEAVLLAFWSGAIVGISILCLSRGSLTIKSEIPFAPFLIFGTFVTFLFGLQLF